MTNPVHVLTVAALLLVGFLIGAIIGTLARLIALRVGRRPVAAVAAPVEAAPAAPPLVAAPVIAPLPIAPAPAPPPSPAEIPVPDFAATLIALANEAPPAAFVEATKRPEPAATPRPEISVVPTVAPPPAEPSPDTMQPAHVAGETTSGIHIAAPLHDAAPEPVVIPEPATAPAAPSEQKSADVILFPAAAPEPVAARPTQIVVGGESVAVVDASDFEDEPVAIPAAEVAKAAVAEVKAEAPIAASIVHGDNFHFVGSGTPAPKAQPPVAAKAEAPASKVEPSVLPQTKAKAETVPIPAISANAAVSAVGASELPRPEVIEAPAAPLAKSEKPEPVVAAAIEVAVAPPPPVVSAPEPVAVAPRPEVVVEEPKTAAVAAPDPVAAPPVEPVPVAVEEPVVAAAPAPVGTADAPVDEDAAMRAIEGNWSPRRTPPRRPVRPAAEPEVGANQAVAASARAVTAARRTAEAIVAEVAEVKAEVKAEAGRPVGLDGPRDGRKDDLTHIIGVLPVIETALNKLGVFHFDQVGSLTDEQIAWIEGHLGVPGRIGRELWREQARELSAVLRPKRVAEK